MADPGNEREQIIRFENLFAEKKFTGLLPLTEQALKDFPESFQIKLLHIKLLMELGKLDQAEVLAQDMLAKYPDNIKLLVEGGNLYLKRGKFPEAKEFYEKVIFHDPFNLSAKKGIEEINALQGAREKELNIPDLVTEEQPETEPETKPLPDIAPQPASEPADIPLPPEQHEVMGQIIEEEPVDQKHKDPLENSDIDIEFAQAAAGQEDKAEQGEHMVMGQIIPREKEEENHDPMESSDIDIDFAQAVSAGEIPLPDLDLSVNDMESRDSAEQEIKMEQAATPAPPQEAQMPEFDELSSDESLESIDPMPESPAAEPVEQEFASAPGNDYPERIQIPDTMSEAEIEAAMTKAQPDEPEPIPEPVESEEDMDFITESAAELYISQELFDDALLIYEKLFSKTGEEKFAKKIIQLKRKRVIQKQIAALEKYLVQIKNKGETVV